MYTIIHISLLWYDWNNIYTIWSLQCSLKTPSSCSSHLADQGWVGKVANFSGFILEQMVITWCYTFHRGPGTLREAIHPPVVFHFWDIWQFHICGWVFDTLLIHFRMHLLFVVTIIYLATAWHIRLPHLQMHSESLMRLLWQWGWNNERLMRIIQMIISERACWYIVGLANISQSKPCLIEPISHLGQPLSPPAHPLGKGNVQLCKLHVTTMSSRKCTLHISKEGQNWIYFSAQITTTPSV